jgi:hypothetical protein
MTPTKSELGLTDELAAVPIRIRGEMWTLESVARYLYHARRSVDAAPQEVLGLAAALAQLRDDAEYVGDTELIGAVDALEESAQTVLIQTE